MRRKFLYVPSMIALAFAVAFAQQTSSSRPSVDRIRQVIEYLASDALEGRRTGTPGANDAAHYIAGEFNRFGLRPGMQMARPARTRGENQARYLQRFPYVAEAQLGEGNLLSFTDGSRDPAIMLKVGEDWMPLGFSSNARIDHAQIVFAGYGISSSELKYDDYANTNAKDSVCVVIEGTPDGDNPHGQFVRAGEVRFKVAAARAAGARALVIVSREPSLREDRLFRLKYDNAGE